MARTTEGKVWLKEYTPPPWLVERVELFFDLEPAATRVVARLALRRNPASAAGGDPVLDGEGLTTRAVRLDGRLLEAGVGYRIDAAGLTLFDPPSRCLLETEVEIDPQANTALEGLYLSAGNLFTQCEAEGFRRITWYPDRPDVLAPFRATLRADPSRWPVLLCNGNPVAERSLDDGRREVVWEDPFPKPCYLFALVAGDLACRSDRFTTASGRTVEIAFYVREGDLPRCDHAIASLQRAMRWDEEVYGREYDLDRYMVVAVDDFNMGAMENKGLNIFNTALVLADPQTATDVDYENIEAVVAHEYFHNWSGNRVTCRDWFQLSLKEGFTVFRDQQYSASLGSAAVQRIRNVTLLRSRQFTEDAGPMAHPVRPDHYAEINNFYTLTVYEKGAEVVRMLHTLLGPELFRRGSDLYFARHDGQAVTCDDFVAAMAEVSGRDLSHFMRWYDQAGTPRLTARGDYDAASRRYTLELRQQTPATPGQTEKGPLHIPLRLGLLGGDGGELPLQLEGESGAGATTRLLELHEGCERFTFVNLAERPVPSLLRDFSAPLRLDSGLDEADLLHLLRHDCDPFNRWDAAQQLLQRALLDEVARRGRGESARTGFAGALIEALRHQLAPLPEDPAFVAELLTPPDLAQLADQIPCAGIETVDPGLLFAVHEALADEIAVALHDELLAAYHGMALPGWSQSPQAAARRALRNRCLGYLLRRPGGIELALRQFEDANNMTDSAAALRLIADSEESPQRTAALEGFYRRWQGEALVLDKWFAAQAAATRGDAVGRVAALLDHPAYRRGNPNRVRAVVGTFALRNPAAFHHPSGSGYRLLADEALRIDSANPQLAARLFTAWGRWQMLEPQRRGLVEALLREIAAQPLSRDSGEVIERALA